MALSVLALDQLMEGLAKIFVLTLVVIFVPLPERMALAIQIFIVAMVFLLQLCFTLPIKNSGLKKHTK